MGIHEVHYAMVVILSMGIGLFAPPFGVGYYAACAIGRVAPEQGVRPIMGYLASIAVGIVIVATVPWISTGFLAKPAPRVNRRAGRSPRSAPRSGRCRRGSWTGRRLACWWRA